jgi:mono/diheme cytochrome c family protein
MASLKVLASGAVAAGTAVFSLSIGVAGQSAPPPKVTFTKDIAPILQRSCQACHRPDSLAPMSLLTYEDARPYASAMKRRTSIRSRQGTMPPWYIEKDLGIQHYKNDISLSDEEVARIAWWADNGAPRGNPADMAPAVTFTGADAWTIGTPDLVVSTPPVSMKAVSPDWWGSAGFADTGLTEDRYVAAVEIKEVNDTQGKPSATGGTTVGGLFIFHHGIMSVEAPGAAAPGGISGGWPVHEVGRNADVFNPDAGKLLRAGSRVGFPNVHMHANGKDTTGHLDIAFKFHPKGYQPKMIERTLPIGTGDIDIRGMESGKKIESFHTLQQPTKITVFEPHMHAAAVRMCLDAIWGSRIETLSCSGYDHSWVRSYQYEDDSAPLLPRGTILRVTGYYDNTPANRNVVDPRNWSGLGHRSIDNMNILIMQAVNLTDEKFQEEVAARRERLKLKPGEDAIGCPLCAFDKIPAPRPPQPTPTQAARPREPWLPDVPAPFAPEAFRRFLPPRRSLSPRSVHLALRFRPLTRTSRRFTKAGFQTLTARSSWSSDI